MRFIPKTTLLIAFFIPTIILSEINQDDYSNPIQASLLEKGLLSPNIVFLPIITKIQEKLPDQQRSFNQPFFNQPLPYISPSQLFAQEIVQVLKKQNVPTVQHYRILVAYFAQHFGITNTQLNDWCKISDYRSVSKAILAKDITQEQSEHIWNFYCTYQHFLRTKKINYGYDQI
ncbi:hypothetical protein HYV11_03685, partial [Candidatus Dependentiae bacterium]|nr:hypothetical protein [Candidatus Dependentiae bacterium]